ncbi:MAG: hypothetical protein GWP13_00095 [Planctomycetia bacterium]|nr:hypothetical protein [Planctomycetia bacterium]
MAKLRSEAVRARRLAEHIESLSQQTAAYKHKRKRAMTDKTIVDPGHAQRLQRRTDGKPAPGASQLNFNPVHPSMELPPEQLIRLLGMESKKTRKSRKPRRAPKRAAAAVPATVDTHTDSAPPPAKARPQAARPTNRNIQYERCEAPQVFDEGHSRLLVPSLLVGVVAGIAVSGYLFWYQPADTAVQKTPAPVIAKQRQKPQPKGQLVKRTPAPVATPATKQKMSAQENAAWRARVEAQQQRLHSAAEQRLAGHISQQQQPAQQVEATTAPVIDTPPLPVTVPATAPEPVTEAAAPTDTTLQAPPQPTAETNSDALSPAPVPVTVEMPDGVESPAEFVTPDEPTAVNPAPVAAITEPDAAATDEMPDSEPAPAVPEATDIEPAALAPTEMEPLTPVTPADESPAAPADDDLL